MFLVAGVVLMEMTPMMQQYLATKEQNPGAILFFRLGDFYEMFFEDAKLVSKELGLTLTSRSKGQDAPMCGVPYHAAETYVNKLVKRGYKVAIAEQIGDPKAKGLTKRARYSAVTIETFFKIQIQIKTCLRNHSITIYCLPSSVLRQLSYSWESLASSRLSRRTTLSRAR